MEGAGARTGPLHHRTDEAMVRDQKDPNDETAAAAQRARWQTTRTRPPQMYGIEPSEATRLAAEIFRAACARTILELGAGYGRDALLLARERVTVHATDFSTAALEQLGPAAQKNDIAHRVTTTVHEVRDQLAVADTSVDAVFAHMLLRMALSTAGTSGAFPLTRWPAWLSASTTGRRRCQVLAGRPLGLRSHNRRPHHGHRPVYLFHVRVVADNSTRRSKRSAPDKPPARKSSSAHRTVSTTTSSSPRRLATISPDSQPHSAPSVTPAPAAPDRPVLSGPFGRLSA